MPDASHTLDLHRSIVAAPRNQGWLAAAAGCSGLAVLGGGIAVVVGRLTADEACGDGGVVSLAAGLTAMAACLPAWLLGRARCRVAEAAATSQVGSAGGLFTASDGGAAAVVADEERRLVALAGWPQAAVGATAAAAAIASVVLAWPGVTTPQGTSAITIAVVAGILAFAVLVVERRLHQTPSADLPESGRLARICRMLLLALAAAAAAAGAGAAGLAAAGWIHAVIAALIAAIASELLLRALAAPFLPVRGAGEARAVGDTALTGILFARLNPFGSEAATAADGGGLKERFGIDLSHSWALTFVRRTAMWVALGLAVGGWLLTGVTTVAIDERGLYESLGRPTAVLAPGLHAHLPWPLGAVQRMDNGRLHTAVLGSSEAADPGRPFDRLWEVRHAGEGEYLIPGRSGDGTTIPYLVSCDTRVMWRLGGDDADVYAYAMRVADGDALVRRAAARRLSHLFATRPLDALLGSDRDRLADAIADGLHRELSDLAGGSTGIEIVSVVVDSIHPPTGAATAYHGVQAASHQAAARIAAGRTAAARRVAIEAKDAAVAKADAAAKAGEAVAAAAAEAAGFNALLDAHRAGRGLVERERWRASLAANLKHAQLTIVDHRLDLGDGPTIDLRRFAPPVGSKD